MLALATGFGGRSPGSQPGVPPWGGTSASRRLPGNPVANGANTGCIQLRGQPRLGPGFEKTAAPCSLFGPRWPRANAKGPGTDERAIMPPSPGPGKPIPSGSRRGPFTDAFQEYRNRVIGRLDAALADPGGHRRGRLSRPRQAGPACPATSQPDRRRGAPAGTAAAVHRRRPRNLADAVLPGTIAGPARPADLRAGQRRPDAVRRRRQSRPATAGDRTAGPAGALLPLAGRRPPRLGPAGSRLPVTGGASAGGAAGTGPRRPAPAGPQQRRRQPGRHRPPVERPWLRRQSPERAGTPRRAARAPSRRPRRRLVGAARRRSQPSGGGMPRRRRRPRPGPPPPPRPGPPPPRPPPPPAPPPPPLRRAQRAIRCATACRSHGRGHARR